jgi:hypothetical protein
MSEYEGRGIFFQIPEGQFILFSPEDAHLPCVTFKEPGPIRKIVIKRKLDRLLTQVTGFSPKEHRGFHCPREL